MSTVNLAAENFLLPNATLVVELVAFLVVLFVLWKWVVPPLSESLQQRQEMVRKQVEDSEEASRKLKAAEDRYAQSLAEARNEAAKIRDNARADGERVREELRGKANSEVERIRARGEEQLAGQRDEVAQQLRGELGGVATQLAEQLIGRKLSDDDRKRSTVEEFLAKLDGPGSRNGENQHGDGQQPSAETAGTTSSTTGGGA